MILQGPFLTNLSSTTAVSPLQNAEEAQIFLMNMRKAQKDGSISHQPPSNLSADGMDAWYLQQKQREMELRERRREAEAMLRGYRMSATGIPRSASMRGFGSPMSAVSESLDDPDSHSVYNNSAPSRRHTIHGGGTRRGLNVQYGDGDSNPSNYNLKTPVSGVSFANAFEEAAAREEEEKKNEHEPKSSFKGRNAGETPFPIDEKHGGEALLPETIWRDFITSGTFCAPTTFALRSS